ncbi:hypothetical protein RNAN_2462 [Rheinheimera nanhaiensis E407-8]|uniref:Uncharacterized protein n=1 Tax=Rheinheimera nanhaiensis E407-8 TaxID=562729 RepID=I1DZH8_9GAMM|nr:hypothetical protein RNAN_2462 [Rheinheimera nanhaiensis E407-8]
MEYRVFTGNRQQNATLAAFCGKFAGINGHLFKRLTFNQPSS